MTEAAIDACTPAGAERRGGEGLARACAVAGVGLALGFLTLAAPRLLNDPDTLWHVRVGSDIIASRSLPTVDAYSHTDAGSPWIAKEWLSQALYGGAHDLAGWTGVVCLAIAALVASFSVVHRAVARELAPLPAFAIAFWAFAMSSGAFLARPHALALPVALWFIDDVWRRARDRAPPNVVSLAALCVWANLHGSIAIGLAAVAFASAHAVIANSTMANAAMTGWSFSLAGVRDALLDERSRRWIAFAAAAPLAACIHPYGIEALRSTLVIAGSPAKEFIREWRSFTIGGEPVMALHLLVAGFCLLTSRFRAPVFAAAFALALLAMYLAHVRFACFLLLATPIVLARDIARAAPSLLRGAQGDRPGDMVEASLTRIGRGAAFAFAVVAAIAVATIAVVGPRPPARVYPLAAIDAARNAGVEGNVLNAYNFGGALLFEGVPTFLDGRTDRLFDEGRFFAEVMRNINSPAALDRYIETYDIGWTILPPGHPFDAMLEARPEWTRLYADDVAVVRQRTP
ncbi:MAG: hypothetical protein GC152_10115 [Alphaproteobacteria bacterium]|nr:hypothetical protein [Alphaproteobacteria bacterium]